MLTSYAQEMMEGMTDGDFCQCLLAMLRNPPSKGESPFGLDDLYEEWVLARLRVVKQRTASIFYGQFLTALRRDFHGYIYPLDLLAAIEHTMVVTQADQGDVVADTWATEMDEVFHYGLPKGADPGWPSLAEYYRPLLGDITVVTGEPSHMKSTLTQGIAVNLARQSGWNFSIWTPEHDPLGSLGNTLMQFYTGQPCDSLSPEDYTQARGWVTDHFHVIKAPGEIAPTLPWLLEVARHQKQKYGAAGLILDPWNWIEHRYDRREESETDYISRSLGMVHRFADAQRMHVWIVAHPQKPTEGKATSGPYKGHYPPRTAYDISGSAHWYNKADNVLSGWRNAKADSPIVEIHVQKVRRRIQCGRPGWKRLRFDGFRFQEHPDEDETEPLEESKARRSHWTEKYS